MSLSEARMREAFARARCVRAADAARAARELDSVTRDARARHAMHCARMLAWAEAEARSIALGA